jgi:hypothetical protein
LPPSPDYIRPSIVAARKFFQSGTSLFNSCW